MTENLSPWLAVVAFVLAALAGFDLLVGWARHDWHARGNLLCGATGLALMGVLLLT